MSGEYYMMQNDVQWFNVYGKANRSQFYLTSSKIKGQKSETKTKTDNYRKSVE